MKNPTDEKYKEYHSGLKNKLVRLYFYLQRGLMLFNELRYLIIGIFGLCLAIKLTNPITITIIFISALLLLILFGYIYTYYMAKTMDFLNIQHSTHWGRYQYQLLEEIRDGINRKDSTTS